MSRRLPRFTVRSYNRSDCGCVYVTEVWLGGISRQRPDGLCANHLHGWFNEAIARKDAS